MRLTLINLKLNLNVHHNGHRQQSSVQHIRSRPLKPTRRLDIQPYQSHTEAAIVIKENLRSNGNLFWESMLGVPFEEPSEGCKQLVKIHKC